MLSTIRFIHTADLHLDSPFKGMTGLPMEALRQLRESTFTAFTNLIHYALETKPDFVVIVGDIYDGDDRSLRAQHRFQEGMKKLHEADIPVFISYGNHDHLSGRWARFELPPNVHVFDGDVGQAEIEVRGQAVVIHGFSYLERHIREAMIERFPVAETSEAFHIGMLHGSLAGDTSHAVYAPFTKEALLSKRYDYWGLGHIHLRQQLHAEPPIVYPGNIQGRHRNERGWKGFYEVTLTKTDAELNFIQTSAVVFERLEISCEGMSHANEWFAACSEAIDMFKTTYPAGIVELTMIDIDQEAADLFRQSTEEEWLDVLREFIEESDPFVWVHKISFAPQTTDHTMSNALAQSIVTVMDSWTEDEWKIVLKDVYQHTRGVKYLDVLTEDEIKEIQTDAEKVLAAEMTELK